MAIGSRQDYNGGMSNPSVSQAERPASNRSKFLPIAIGAVAIVVGIGAWVVAAPGGQVTAGPPQVGKPVPPLELPSTSGGTWNIRDHRGREVLVVFFRTHT